MNSKQRVIAFTSISIAILIVIFKDLTLIDIFVSSLLAGFGLGIHISTLLK